MPTPKRKSAFSKALQEAQMAERSGAQTTEPPSTQAASSSSAQTPERSDVQTTRRSGDQATERVVAQTSSSSDTQAPSEPKWKRQTVYLYPDLYRWVRHHIADTDQDISNVVNEALRQYRARLERTQKEL